MSEQPDHSSIDPEIKKQLDALAQPANPFSQMTEGAIGLHEMYTSYVEAGFTRSEALELVARVLVYSGREYNPPPE